MADLIRLLPDSIANQIAAGEVVQRPASVVKELMENAIDAGADRIKLIVKDAGKTLIQVIDNGCGMSETDARMCFERHATSKIRSATDLFAIRTMGFRGEALASIAAVAQVEMRTRLHEQELGTRIVIEGSQVKTQEPCQCVAGTNISVKNLFFNVPARRNFLKSDSAELRHILDEFQRIAIAHPEVFFSLHHQGNELFHLPPGNLRQRIVGVFGSKTNEKLVPVQEETEALRIHGFVGKPDYARKTRGEQMFFVNRRFIKSGYLNHAVLNAYEGLLPKDRDAYPLYVLFLEIDPAQIDINVHPTKQEIKFDDERLVYKYLTVAVRHALGRYSSPTLDFEQELSFSPVSNFGKNRVHAASGSSSGQGSKGFSPPQTLRNWQELYEGLSDAAASPPSEPAPAPADERAVTIESQWSHQPELDDDSQSFSRLSKEPFQLHGAYIISPIKSGFLLIDQQAAHERILYERFLEQLQRREADTQRALFPKTIQLPPSDALILQEILPTLQQLGFDIQEFGMDTFVLHGCPSWLRQPVDEKQIIENFIEQYKNNGELHLKAGENIARSMAKSAAIKRGQVLSTEEMKDLIDRLFACRMPYKSPGGRHCFLEFSLDELDRKLQGG
ncbi:MAG: DNA mismatch repair endonuclease MutL [Bacteroidetes bacterium]|nr:MAG: DNA mismatch repair endonuclease MutL [Bacteroidota bacterium]